MKVEDIAKELDLIKAMNILAQNEISGNLKVAYKFSWAKIGNSGYSFGRSQFDVSNNKYASQFLKNKCEFTDSEIKRLLKMDPDIEDLNVKLYKHRYAVDAYDKLHVSSLVSYIANLENLPEMNEETFIHLIDYHNQFNLSCNGKMHRYLQSLKKATPEDILNFKLNNIKWGRMYPSDVKRRWNNIHKFYS